MIYKAVTLNQEIEIRQLVTVHYFEYGSAYSFAGESHDFWEFLCVDKGDVEVATDTQVFQLSRGDIIFHKPNEFHRLTASPGNAPNLVVISFVCNSPAMSFFAEKILHVDAYERELLAHIITEAANAFEEPLNNPAQTHMVAKQDAPFASGQFISLHLELFLLHLMRRNLQQKRPPFAKKEHSAKETIRRRSSEETYNRILEYLNQHLNEHLTIEQIARDNLVGASRLQQLIRERHKCGVISFFCQLKINQAKQHIRENKLNFTEISDLLGYNSVHYFSRQFKKLTGMTPSEYSSSIKRLSESSHNL